MMATDFGSIRRMNSSSCGLIMSFSWISSREFCGLIVPDQLLPSEMSKERTKGFAQIRRGYDECVGEMSGRPSLTVGLLPQPPLVSARRAAESRQVARQYQKSALLVNPVNSVYLCVRQSR